MDVAFTILKCNTKVMLDWGENEEMRQNYWLDEIFFFLLSKDKKEML